MVGSADVHVELVFPGAGLVDFPTRSRSVIFGASVAIRSQFFGGDARIKRHSLA
jgi:hypothetical protein